MILLYQRYAATTPERQAELDLCAEMNARSLLFEEIRGIDVDVETRMTYGDFFRLCASEYNGKLCVVANSDILFDDTARLLETVVAPGRIVALTRWEPLTRWQRAGHSPRMLGHFYMERFYSGTQDSWAFIGGELVGIGDAVPLGFVGCDQAILGECYGANIEIADPALDIKTWHQHADETRPHRPSMSGVYGYPELTTTLLSYRVITHGWPLSAR